MSEMAKLRQIELRTIHYAIEELSVPMDHYGACIGSCVFVEY